MEIPMNIDAMSVVVSTYDDPISNVSQCLESLLIQDKIYEIIVIDSSKKDYIKNVCHSLKNDKIKYVYTHPTGLSDARNEGIKISKRNIVAFTDADCIADRNWAENICNHFTENVAVVGGKVLPKWMLRPTRLYLYSTIAQGYFSLFDIGNKLKEVDEIFGGNFAINRNFVNEQFFSSELGRNKKKLLSGEETEFCKQVRMKKLKIIYCPLAIVWHQIPEERLKLKWMWNRTYYGGISRAMVGGRPTPKSNSCLNYNIYDIIFMAIFSIPYILGLYTYKFKRTR